MNEAKQVSDLCVIGLGYIGLPTASIFATKGLNVVGVDVRPDVVEGVNSGRVHFHEPDLDVMVRAAVGSGLLRASLNPEPASVFVIAVPTPFVDHADGRKTPDLSFVEAASRRIAGIVKPGDLIILESTSPVGTTERVKAWIDEERGRDGGDMHYAHCPERILPGNMLKELVSNDRIVGGITPEATARAAELYRKISSGTIHCTDARTAEMAKLAENSYRDVNIAFANELSMLCGELGVDVWELIRLANCHPRVNILSPGPGVGGHCIAVDPWFLISASPDHGRLMKTARETNDEKRDWVIAQALQVCADTSAASIACLGLAFKANVDDLRESPAVYIAEHLARQSVDRRVMVVEPHAHEMPRALAGLVEKVELERAIEEADLLLLLVDHRQFADVPDRCRPDQRLIDVRGMWRRGR